MFLTIAFLVVVGTLLPLQLSMEIADGERPLLLELFAQPPSEEHLRTFERDLERRNPIANPLRPWVQMLNFTLLADGGDRGIRGRDGWLFYRPGVRYLTEPWPQSGDHALAAIRSLSDQLAERGIQLLVLPVPGKASIYPDRLRLRGEELPSPPNHHTRQLVDELRNDGIEVLDLTAIFAQARGAPGEPDLYLTQDTHWSPHGVRNAARMVASRLLALGWIERGTTDYTLASVPIQRHGDIVRMMQSPPLERLLPTEEVSTQVVRDENGEPYADTSDSQVLILGDSFLRIYEEHEPGSAGLRAHLAREIGFPLTSIVNAGGASTLVRQQLSRTPELLEGKRVVIWEFIERDIRFGVEGWQEVNLR